MKIVILNSRERFRKQDLKTLNSHKAIFYQNANNKLSDIKELKDKEEVILGVQPSFIAGSWDGLTLEKLKPYKNIKAICLSTTAYGWVPFMKLAKQGTVVTNVPGKSTDAVGEYYIFMMIALLRNLPLVIKNNWSSDDIPSIMGTNAKGLKAGIVGMGKIGSKIADLCNGHEMEVCYWSKSKKQTSYKFLTLDKLFKTCDVIFLTTTSDESTKGLITDNMINSMKKTAILLTPIDDKPYNKKLVLDKVAKGELGGFGFESSEEMLVDFKGNVFVAPEVGYYTHQTIDNESQIMTESMISILEGKPKNKVN